MARLELGIDVTVEGARELARVADTLDGTSAELDELADHLDAAADSARRMSDDIDTAAGSLRFDRATSSAQSLEDAGEGVRNLVNGIGDAFTAAGDSSLTFGERLALGAGGLADIANGARNAVIPALEAITSGALASGVATVQSVGKQLAAWALLGVQSLLHAAKVALAWLIAMGPLGALVAAVVAVVALIIANWEEVSKFLGEVFAAIGDALASLGEFFVSVWEGMLDFLGGVVDAIADIGRAIWEPIATGFEAAVDVIKAIWNAFVGFWNGIQITVPSVDLPLIGRVGGFTIGLPDLPMLAAGGIVTRPTLAMIGEAGPEAVLPLDRLGAMGAPTVNLTINGDVTGDERRLPGHMLRALYVAGLT